MAMIALAVGQERIVHFPSDRPVGRLSVQDAESARDLASWFHWTETGERPVEYLCEAKGEVHVPPGKRLILNINQSGWKDLSWLSKLRPDDLYGLSLTALLMDPVKPSDGCMEHIAHLTRLKHLDLDRTDVTDKGFRYIRNLSSLEYLSMPYRVTDEGMTYIAELSSLKGLYFSELGSHVTDAGLHHLAKLTALEELALWGERMGDAGLAHLRGLPRLEYLCLYSTHFTDNGLVHLQSLPALRILSVYEGRASFTNAGLVHIARMPRLEMLCLGGIRSITDDGLAHLTKTRSLKKLDIGASQVTDRGLAYLSQIKTLERLDLPQDQKGITDKGLSYIGELPNLRHLEISRLRYADLRMNREYYTDKGLESLAKCRNLEHLSIGSIGISDAGMDHIAKLTNLKWLHLFGCLSVTDKGLAKLAVLKSLTSLQVAHSDMTIAGLNQLNSLSNVTMLRVHDLRRGGAVLNLSGFVNLEDLMLGFAHGSDEVFTDGDLACLGELKKLKRLQIGPRRFSDSGLSHLAGLADMELLQIGGPTMTDQGLKCLANMKNLEVLDIFARWDASKNAFVGGGRLTDEGLRYLEGFNRLSLLEIASDNTFSPAAIQHLRQELPYLYRLTINGRSIVPSASPVAPGPRMVRPPQSPAPVRQRSGKPGGRR